MKGCSFKRPQKRAQRKKRRIMIIIWVLTAAVAAAGILVQGLMEYGYINLYAGQGMQIEPIYQFDYTEEICRINGQKKSVASSGCGAACLSMVITYLTDNESQTPHTLFADAYANGDYTGYGLSHEAIDRLASAHGIEGAWVESSEIVIVHALKDGYPIIAHMGPGTFTNDGHYILLRGVTEDGRILVNDPNSKRRSARAYPFHLIDRETKGDTPFRICWKANGDVQN